MKKINHIVISGNIGVGKTTLSEKISKKFNWELQLEEVKDNPYLDDFYADIYDKLVSWSLRFDRHDQSGLKQIFDEGIISLATI